MPAASRRLRLQALIELHGLQRRLLAEQRRGDPRAYHLVRLHFDELFRVADEQGGLMLKTIGDAVMAAFQTPGAAMRAAQAMLRAVAALNERAELRGEERLVLKVGVHIGPR